MSDEAIEGVGKGKGASRALRIYQAAQNSLKDVTAKSRGDAVRDFHTKVQAMQKKGSAHWTEGDIRSLNGIAKDAIQESLEIAETITDNEYIKRNVRENVETELGKAVVLVLIPELEHCTWDAFTDLKHTLNLKNRRPKGDGVDGTSPLTPLLPTHLRPAKLRELVDDADIRATELRVQGAADFELTEQERARLGKSWKKTASEFGKHPEDIESGKRTNRRVAVGLEEAEDLAVKALQVMRELREELTPSWTPETDPGWIAESSKRSEMHQQAAFDHVYRTTLGACPKDLLQETQAWDGVQDLFKQNRINLMRANDALSRAVSKRKAS